MDLRFKTTDTITYDGGFTSTTTCVYPQHIQVDAENNEIIVVYCLFRNKTECDNYLALAPQDKADYKGLKIFKKPYAATDTELEAVGLMTFIKNKLKGEFTTTVDY